MINDILDLSKIEANAYERVDDWLELDACVAECARSFSLEAARRSIVLTAAAEEGLKICSDRRALRHILVNLIANAIKFSEDGGRVEVRGYRLSGGKVGLSVTDNGVGMSKEFVERAMEPFAQADAITSRAHGGTGLGLAIVHNYALLLGGVIRIDSTPGVGTLIELTMPTSS